MKGKESGKKRKLMPTLREGFIFETAKIAGYRKGCERTSAIMRAKMRELFKLCSDGEFDKASKIIGEMNIRKRNSKASKERYKRFRKKFPSSLSEIIKNFEES